MSREQDAWAEHFYQCERCKSWGWQCEQCLLGEYSFPKPGPKAELADVVHALRAEFSAAEAGVIFRVLSEQFEITKSKDEVVSGGSGASGVTSDG